MDMVFMLLLMVIVMKVNGIMINVLEMEHYIWLVVINILVNGKMVKNLEKVFIIFHMVIHMMVYYYIKNLGNWLGGMRHGYGKY